MMTELSVFGWAADNGGCGYYRIGLPMWALQQAYGIHAEAGVQLPKAAMAEAAVIVGQRVCNPGPSILWQRLAKEGKRLVFEIDDHLWRVHDKNEIAANFFSNPDVRRRLVENIEVSQMVTVTSETLANVILDKCPSANVVILPNCIDNALRKLERPHYEKLTVGWSGSTTHQPDFEFVAPQLKRFLSKHPEVDMHFIGTTYERLLKRKCRGTPWATEVTEYYKLIDYDIGILPLAYDTFNRSKSPIKALEYAALGIPVVATDFGPYSDFVQHGKTGFLVRKEHEWFNYLRDLVNDEDMRTEMGKAAHLYAGGYTIQGGVHLWKEAYEKLLKPQEEANDTGDPVCISRESA